MDKKIIAIMVSLLVIAGVVAAVVAISTGGGLRSSGGFTKLFDKLDAGIATDEEYLQLPSGWNSGDVKKVSDVIIDMTYEKRTIQQTSVYITQLWFVYMGEKWSDQYEGGGSDFYVPVTWGSGWLHVEHGQFSITVSSATNLSLKYTNGDVISLESTLESVYRVTPADYIYQGLAFGEWTFSEGF